MTKKVRKSFKDFYTNEKHEMMFEKTFSKYYKRGHWGEMRKELIREQQKDWWEKLKNLIEEKDYGSLLMAVGHRKNKVSREMFSKLTGINIKQKTTKIIKETLREYCLKEDILSRKELIDALEDMDVPQMRINKMDIGWLQRNLGIRNSKHPKFKQVMITLREMK